MIEIKPENDNPDHATRVGRTLTTEGLFAGATQVNISHNGEIYRLRITSNGKLILTK